MTIECMHCKAVGSRADLGKNGWQLAKNKPFFYVCARCKALPEKTE